MAETPVVTPIEIVGGADKLALRQSDWIDARVLAANVAETFQAPALARYVLFSSDGAFYCRIAAASTSATVPAGDVTDGSASELNPAMRYIGEQEYISLIAAAACTITMQYFRS